MSKQVETEFVCPQCEKPGKAHIYQSVNVTLSPELKEKVLNFELFLASCPHCDAQLAVTNHFLYHDMDRGIMLQMHPLPDRDRWREYVRYDEEGFRQSVGMMGGDKTANVPDFRICFGPLELKEKILLFDAGLNDKVVETCKLRFLVQKREEFQDKIPSVYFGGQRENGDMELIIMDESTGDGIGRTVIPADLLNEDQTELMQTPDVAFVLEEPYVNVWKLFLEEPTTN